MSGSRISTGAWWRAGALVLAIGMAGCSSVKPYEQRLPTNLRVNTQVEPGSLVQKSIAVGLDVHRVKPDCSLEHLGRRELDGGTTDMGLPVGEPLYLEVIFVRSARLSSHSSAVRHGTMITLVPGSAYSARASHLKGLYDVEWREQPAGSAGARPIERRGLDQCTPR